jgi:hypothetical protein
LLVAAIGKKVNIMVMIVVEGLFDLILGIVDFVVGLFLRDRKKKNR